MPAGAGDGDSGARLKRVRTLFDSAIEKPAPDRRAYLEQAAGSDPSLRDEVLSLLEAEEAGRGFLSTPAVLPEGSLAADAPAAPAQLAAGTRLGPYEITGLLGAGGMGEVYRAMDARLGRDVAVKVLPADVASSAERLSRFEQEARAASALNHPHILAVYDVGRDGGIPYLVTELLEGRTLADRLGQGPIPVRKALEWSAQAARGLAAAHERGIVHRDLKPANLFLTEGGALKILDFGLAKLGTAPERPPGTPAGGTPHQTAAGLRMGTVGYMSPEQARGEAVDFRSDQFSLGCVVYEMLTGGTPFARPSAAQTLAAVLAEEPVPLLARNPRLPAPVAWTVERCLAKDPEDRYAATRDLARDLELALGRLSGLGPPVAPPSRSRTRVLAAALAASAMAALIIWAMRPGAPPSAAPAPSVRYLTFSGRDGSPAASPDGKTIAFSSSRDGRRRIWLVQLATGVEAPLTAGDDDHPRFSPDGSVIVFTRTEGKRHGVYRVPSIGGEPRKVIDDGLYADFAPDGRRIAVLRQRPDAEGMTSLVVTVDPDGGHLREVGRFPGRALVRPRWSPDGRTLAIADAGLQAGERTAAMLVDASTGRSRDLASAAGTRSPEGLAWAGPAAVAYPLPATALGTYTLAGSAVVVQDVQSARARTVLSVPFDVRVLDVLAAGRVVFGARSFRACLREVSLRGTTRDKGKWLTRGSSTDRQPVYSPDGEWVVFSSNRGGNLDLWAVSRSTGAVRRLTDDAAEDWDPAFMSDGKLLWSSNRTGSFEVWMANADGTGAHQVTRDAGDAENPVATSDRRWILYASAQPRSRGIMKVRADGSEPTRLLAGNVLLPELSPDGRHLASVTDLGADHATLRVTRVADGATVHEVPLSPWLPADDIDVGRCRWLPDGRGLAFIDRDADGAYGVYVQAFPPGREARRRLVALEPDLAAESIGISPDGSRLTISYWDQLSNLMVGEHVPEVEHRPAAQPPRP